jgi:hypothetical protein
MGNEAFRIPDELKADNVPVLAQAQLNAFRFRIGVMQNQEGETVGAIIELWLDPLPWFRIRLPMAKEHAQRFITQLEETLNAEV